MKERGRGWMQTLKKDYHTAPTHRVDFKAYTETRCRNWTCDLPPHYYKDLKDLKELIDFVYNQFSGSLISRSSLQSPVKTVESVSMGLNLMRAEGTKSSASSVVALSPTEGIWGITLRLTATGCNSSNSKPGSFSAALTNWK